MRWLFLTLKKGWRSFREPSSPSLPYAVTCLCGQRIQGIRSLHAQTPRCPACNERHFVLSLSPYPPSPDEEPSSELPQAVIRSAWLVPMIAAGITLLLVVGGLTFLFTHFFSEPDGGSDLNKEETSTREIIERGRRFLGERQFGKALETLDEGTSRGDAELLQMRRQASLLSKLLDLPLQDIIQKGQNVRNAEAWRQEFRDRYRGWSVLFDDWVRRNPDGTHELVNYQILVGEEKAVMKFDLDLLRRLPLGQPRRLLFGARLENLSRGEGGLWVIEFEKESGVLLTEEGAALALGLGPLDQEMRELLREQAKWSRLIPLEKSH